MAFILLSQSIYTHLFYCSCQSKVQRLNLFKGSALFRLILYRFQFSRDMKSLKRVLNHVVSKKGHEMEYVSSR